MKSNDVKKELVKRYKYLYENSIYILASYVFDSYNNEHNQVDSSNKNISMEELLLIEEFMLGDTACEESEFYRHLEKLKEDEVFLNKVYYGIQTINLKKQKYKDTRPAISKVSDFELGLNELLKIIYVYLNKQPGEHFGKNRKLLALDEYMRILRYKNDGNIWTSGLILNVHDMSFYDGYSNSVNLFDLKLDKITETGVKNSNFIKYISNPVYHHSYNSSVLTEKEKQDIYLSYHNELPCDLRIKCSYDNSDLYLQKPNNTNPCFCNFDVVEDLIFFKEFNNKKYYYQLCPECGYINSIPANLLSHEVRARIEKKTEDDPNLFRKMCLYSELFYLEKDIKDINKRLTRKINKK